MSDPELHSAKFHLDNFTVCDGKLFGVAQRCNTVLPVHYSEGIQKIITRGSPRTGNVELNQRGAY